MSFHDVTDTGGCSYALIVTVHDQIPTHLRGTRLTCYLPACSDFGCREMQIHSTQEYHDHQRGGIFPGDCAFGVGIHACHAGGWRQKRLAAPADRLCGKDNSRNMTLYRFMTILAKAILTADTAQIPLPLPPPRSLLCHRVCAKILTTQIRSQLKLTFPPPARLTTWLFIGGVPCHYVAAGLFWSLLGFYRRASLQRHDTGVFLCMHLYAQVHLNALACSGARVLPCAHHGG